MISFTANLISRPKIKIFNSKGQLVDTKAAFMELDPNSVGDNKALEKLVSYWGRKDTYVRVIEDNFKYNKYNPNINTTERFFVLAEPKRQDMYLDSKKILAVAQTSSKGPKNKVEIDYFQVIPKYIERHMNCERKHVGSKMIDSLKQLFKGKKLWLYSTNEAADFYKKNGFVQKGVSEVGLPIMEFLG